MIICNTNEGYITEVQYNQNGFPIMHEIRSMRDDYIGHITLNYKLVRSRAFVSLELFANKSN